MRCGAGSAGDTLHGGIVLRIFLIALALSATAYAADPASDAAAPDARQNARQQAVANARAALVKGPTEVALRDQATLSLPAGFGFVPQQQAAALMRTMGNTTDNDFLGLIFPQDGPHWFVSVHYEASGYVKDDDAQHWDADKLLQSLKDGTEAANEARIQAGAPALVVTRWIEPPQYESDTHRLVWSAEARHKDGMGSDPTVNYNTYLLGREGFVSLNLITSASVVDEDKRAARELLAAVTFNSGKRYGDFNSSTDKVAAYGLAALVAGVAAKKLGLLALLAAMALKFAKIIAVAVAAFFVAIKRWLKGRVGQQA
jgi:uncharacterized membrane-anchored protein